MSCYIAVISVIYYTIINNYLSQVNMEFIRIDFFNPKLHSLILAEIKIVIIKSLICLYLPSILLRNLNHERKMT